MASKLFVAGLAWATTDDTLRDFFSQVGTVTSANVIKDKFTGRSRGFGFVEMSTPEEADKAIQELNGKDLDGRTLTINEARPQESRDSGGNGGGFQRGGFDRRDNSHGNGGGRDSRGGRR